MDEELDEETESPDELTDVAGVVRIDDTDGALNGKYPLSEQLLRRTYYRFKEWYPVNNGFSSINSTYPPPRHKCSDECSSVAEGPGPSCTQIVVGKDHNEITQEKCAFIDDLPDHVMLSVFRHFHPVELAHLISQVCGRWYRLSQSPVLWREVRIFACKNPSCRSSLRTFLHKHGRFIRKLCVYYDDLDGRHSDIPSETELLDVFPQLMPSVTTLDLGDFFYLSNTVARFIAARFPNLERLNLELVRKADQDSFGLLVSQGLTRLNELVIDCYTTFSVGTTSQDFNALTEGRFLLALSANKLESIDPSICHRIASSQMASTLISLCIPGRGLGDDAYEALKRCRNLRLLAVSDFTNGTDRTLGYLKMLSKLEHLHLLFAENVTEDGWKKFFEIDRKAGSALTFPAKLKYLSLDAADSVTDGVVDSITVNCPKLASLCLENCYTVTDVGLTYVFQRLRDLQFLDISGMDRVTSVSLNSISLVDLTQLKYLCLVGLCIDAAVVHTLSLQRKRLVICYDEETFAAFEILDSVARFFGCRDMVFQQAVYDKFSDIEGFCCMTNRFTDPSISPPQSERSQSPDDETVSQIWRNLGLP